MPGPSPLTHDGSGWGILSRLATSCYHPPAQWVNHQRPYPRVEHSERVNAYVHPRRERAGVEGSKKGALTTPPPMQTFSATLICCCTDTAHGLQCKVQPQSTPSLFWPIVQPEILTWGHAIVCLRPRAWFGLGSFILTAQCYTCTHDRPYMLSANVRI